MIGVGDAYAYWSMCSLGPSRSCAFLLESCMISVN